MTRFFWKNWKVILLAPPALAVAIFGLWVAVAAAYENIRLADATNQLLETVATARAMSIGTKSDDTTLTASLLNQLAANPSLNVVRNGATPTGLLNPWDNTLTVAVQSATQSLRFETSLPATACRRLLTLMGKDPAALGLQRVESRNDTPASPWRQVYELSTATLATTAIRFGCDQAPTTTLALTFRLR